MQINELDCSILLRGTQWLSIKFLHANVISYNYLYPKIKDSCYISTENILFILNDPTLTAEISKVQYCFNKDELKTMMAKFINILYKLYVYCI